MTNPNDNAHPIVNPITHKVSGGLTKREHLAFGLATSMAANPEILNGHFSCRISIPEMVRQLTDGIIAELNRPEAS